MHAWSCTWDLGVLRLPLWRLNDQSHIRRDHGISQCRPLVLPENIDVMPFYNSRSRIEETALFSVCTRAVTVDARSEPRQELQVRRTRRLIYTPLHSGGLLVCEDRDVISSFSSAYEITKDPVLEARNTAAAAGHDIIHKTVRSVLSGAQEELLSPGGIEPDVRQDGEAGTCIAVAAVIVHAFRTGTESSGGYDRLKTLASRVGPNVGGLLMKRSVPIQPFAVPYKKVAVFCSITFFSFLTVLPGIDTS